MSNPTRVQAIWDDVCRRNPRLPHEAPSDWLQRLAEIMAGSRPAQEPETPRLPYRDSD